MSTSRIPGSSRPEVRIDRSDVGRRVSVRRLEQVRDPATGRPVFRDAIGVLTSWDGSELSVLTRELTEVRIPEADLVAAKAVPLFPARRAEVPATGPVALQRIAGRSWPAVEQQALGDWTLRAAAGFTKRANSVQALGDPGHAPGAALDRVRQWYAERGLPAVVEVVLPGSAPELTAELDRLGAVAESATLVRTAALTALTKAPGITEEGVARVRLSRRADEAWQSVYRRPGGAPAQAVSAVLHGGPSVWFATVPGPEGSAPLAIGRCAVDGPWACLGAIEVQPAARRTGLATALMAVLAARAAEEGAQAALLQVETGNDGALALYDKLGFATSHSYHYARLPQA
ncbi:GNAT family N-acetyltransferase [Streptomyces tateyamensis]|uniref:GNAT family N-acetyltransferase n=1 Tax=Streptomyces tateyamensis TaxID=565073 RepID=A0A2V4MW64_9ACTN|nr:GNAT family N-acetyltransferase [Streptomyces tateyamensis]PYC72124.1 GNAT family N-acetyltransferase [Streptomyces tateyamensis]